MKIFPATYRTVFAQLVDNLNKQTKFTKLETQRLLKIYLKLNNNKFTQRLDRQHFRDVLQTMFEMTDDFMMDRIFRAFDQDLDSLISMEEWVKGLSIFLRGTLEEKTKFTFNVYDLNSDGVISKEEMYQLLRNSLVKASEEDPDEGVRDLVETVFKKLDFDKDGKLAFDDFATAVSIDPLLLESLGPCLPDEEVLCKFTATFEEKNMNRIFPPISYLTAETSNMRTEQLDAQ